MQRSLENIKDFLHYSPDTGIFHWKETVNARAVAGAVAGSPDKDGYLEIDWGRKRYKLHQLAWWWWHGEFPPAHLIPDHKNGIVGDNGIDNLRLVTTSQNHMNRRPKASGSSRYKGVTRTSRRTSWMARIGIGGKREKHLGTFKTEEEAARAYDAAAREHFGEFARLNFP